MSRVLSLVLTTALAGLLALAAWTQELWLVAVATLLVQAVVAGGLAPLLGAAAATWVAFDPAVLAGSPEAVAGRDAFLSSGVIAGLLPGAAVVVVGVLVTQMLRRDGRDGLVLAASRAVTLGVLACLASGWVAASRTLLSTEVVLLGAVGLVVAVAVWTLPGDRVVVASAAVVAGAVAGAVAALVQDGLATWVLGVAVGGMAAFSGLLGHAVGRTWTADRPDAVGAWALPAALAVALVGPVVHVAGQLATLAV